MSTQLYPITTVGALAFNQLGKILLLQTHKWNHKYGLPGGKIEWGESAEKALIREFQEETNLQIFDIQFMLVQDCIFSEEFYKEKHFIFLNYICRTLNDNEIILNDEAQDYIWVTPQEALTLDINQPTRQLIETFLSHRKSLQ